MNAQGFRKILKKLDKKLGLDTQQVYWETKVAQLPFVTQDEIVKNIDTLTQWLSNMAVNDSMSGASTPASARYYQTGIIRDLGKHESLVHAIDDDSVDQLKQQLHKLGSGSIDQKFGYAMLERAAIKGSPCCLEYLLSNVKVNPMGRYDINERNLLHKICIGVRDDWVEGDLFSSAMHTVVQKLLQVAPDLNAQVDCIGRRPLHYAAEFGQAALAQLFLHQAIDTGDYSKEGFSDPMWQDREGHTPLFLAILYGNYLTLKELVETGKIDDIDGIIAGKMVVLQHGWVRTRCLDHLLFSSCISPTCS
ncbi:ankyrin [Lichtheimia hyalospora FSU 10163]|nr:ankyrin [Lichtheimia hyalospora FSU 10163]